MFERFTDRARRVLVLAQEEARQLNHSFIGTEHILLGLIHEGEGVAAKVIESLGVTLEEVRQRIEETIGPVGTASTGSPPFTTRAKKVLELSLREALQLGHNYIGTEHMLLGIVREGEGVASQVLVSFGADLSRLRQEVIQLLREQQGADRSETSRVAPPLLDESGEVFRTGESWSLRLVRAGRTPADYAGAYERLAEIAHGLGVELEELHPGHIVVSSVRTTDGPGLSISVQRGAPYVVTPQFVGGTGEEELRGVTDVSTDGDEDKSDPTAE